jgi:hypothetical protein
VSRWRRTGPALVVVAALVAAGVVASVHAGGGNAQAAAGSAVSNGSPSQLADLADNPQLPVTYQMAQRAGRTGDYDWGPHCDPKTGRLRIPTVYATPCVPVHRGGNGGATAAGVGATTITVVYYIPPPGDLTSAIQGVAGTPATNTATIKGFVAMFNHITPTYGRKVRLVPYGATGTSTDAVAARADAIRVAEQIHAFASIGGPAQTPVYEDELAHFHVLCLNCGLGATSGDYQDDAPYLWGQLPPPDTLLDAAYRYVVTQLSGRDAVYAGEKSFHHTKRRFGFVDYETNPPMYEAVLREFTRKLQRAHLNAVLNETYLLDLSTLPAEAATIADHLKRAGATTVVFAGDPVMPIYLTKACAAIGYYPEWVITGTVFTDSSTLGRLYDQKEWAHAFGISSLAVPTPIELGDADHLYRWYYGTTPPAQGTAPVILPSVEQLFGGIALAGAKLTPQTWAGGLFRYPPTGGGPTTPLEAYGEHGAPPTPSYATPADYAFIWYDAAAKGTDTEGAYGSGMVRYVDGGKRYRFGAGPTTEIRLFDPAGTVMQYQRYPPRDAPPTYPPWPGSPTASR